MTVLVTGAAGFIGSHLAQALAARGDRVRAVDCLLPDSYPAAIKRATWAELGDTSGVTLVECDLREELPPDLLDDVDVVVNEAAMPGLMASWTDFDLYAGCNVSVVERLARACSEGGIHLVQVSTSSVYGFEAVGDETTATRPTSPYGVTKLAAEELLHAYARSRGLDFTILRYFSVYGPRQRPDMAYHRIIEAVRAGTEIEIYGDGLQSRTNTFVADCVAATVAAADLRPIGATINIAGPQRVTLLEAIGLIEELVGRPARLRHRPARPGDQRHTGGTTDLAEELLAYRPSTAFADGLAAQVDWHAMRWREHRPTGPGA